MVEYDYPPTDYDLLEPPDEGLFALFPPEDWFHEEDQRVEAAEQNKWHWQDTCLIGVDRGESEPNRYEIGCLDLYADLDSGDLAGNYLMLGQFNDQPAAETFYDQWQHQTETLPIHELAAFVEKQIQHTGWQPATPAEYAAYDRQELTPDNPPTQLPDPLLPVAPGQSETTFQAFGLEIEDRQEDPPPFYDAETGTVYWIGVFQPDKADRTQCITSILSLCRNPETGEPEALLAPCVPGDWERAYQAAEYLIQVAEKGGIQRCFEAAEGMALATDQRRGWEREHGLVLDSETTGELAQYAAQTWEVEL